MLQFSISLDAPVLECCATVASTGCSCLRKPLCTTTMKTCSYLLQLQGSAPRCSHATLRSCRLSAVLQHISPSHTGLLCDSVDVSLAMRYLSSQDREMLVIVLNTSWVLSGEQLKHRGGRIQKRNWNSEQKQKKKLQKERDICVRY